MPAASSSFLLLALALALLTACSGGETVLGNTDGDHDAVEDATADHGDVADEATADGDAVDDDADDEAEDAGEEADASPVCGNALVEEGEDCDDGNFAENDACLPGCRAARCGDGFLWQVGLVEECDDGNTVAGDGCSPDCTDECGNGVVDLGEECDDGPDNSDAADAACRTNCTPRRCGDGVIDTGEECDLLNLDGKTCVMLGHPAGGTLRCHATCHFDESWCRHPTCGDGTCALGETAAGCAADCRDGCGDGFCAEAEDQFGCPADCGAVAISAGGAATDGDFNRACAVLADGTIRCWVFYFADLSNPAPLPGVSHAVRVSLATGAGHHACVTTNDGAVLCWGTNESGQLGDGTYIDRDVPAAVPGLFGGIEAATGNCHSCALLMDGTAACWGWCDGEMGTVGPPSPVVVEGLSGAVEISAGGNATCAVSTDGIVRCWGGHSPLLGDGTDDYAHEVAGPRPVIGLTAVVGLSSGPDHSCALRVDGTVQCWGSNEYGQLGSGADTVGGSSSAPVRVAELTNVVAVSAGLEHSCAALADGTVRVWGALGNWGGYSPFGGTTRPAIIANVPVAVPDVTDAVAVSAGGWAWVSLPPRFSTLTCVLHSTGSVSCWSPPADSEEVVPVQVDAW